jgi:iron uptake system EfeUOB component EfeO/EfeM
MASLSELQQLITEAKTAYHKLQIGQALALVRDQNGEEVRYTQADRGSLRAYIDDLQAQIDALTLPPNPCASGPMRLWF